MDDDLARLLSNYSLSGVMSELWWTYRGVLVLVTIWLCSTLFFMRRERLLASTTANHKRTPPDVWTLPVVLVSLRAVWELWLMFEYAHYLTPHGWLTLQWLVSAAGFAAVAVTILLSSAGAFVGRFALGLEVSVLPRLGLPALMAVLSLVGLHLLISACVHLSLVSST